MEIVWYIIGILIGLLIAWWFLSERCKRQLNEKQTELVNARRRFAQDLERERQALAATKRQLSASEARQSAAAQHTKLLESELTAIRTELENSNAKNTETDSNLQRIQSDMRELESRLKEANRANTELAAQLKDTDDSVDPVGDASPSRVLIPGERNREKERENAALQAKLGSAPSMAEHSSPTLVSAITSKDPPLQQAPKAASRS